MQQYMDRWLTMDEIAEYVGVTRDTIFSWINVKNFPAHKIGRIWRFKIDEVDAWIKESKK